MRTELRITFKTGDVGGSASLLISSLNLSAQATSGRHRQKSSRIMSAISVNNPSNNAPVLPVLAANCRYDPRPGNLKDLFPSTNCSDAIRKNQPPAQLIILFQIRPIIEDGISNFKKRCQGRRRATDENSFRSLGSMRAE